MIWKDVIGYEGLYEISEYGDLKSLPKWRNTGTGGYLSKVKIKSPKKIKKGYFLHELTRDGIAKTFKRSRLVAIAFKPNPNNLPEVNHEDGNKANDHISNLEWISTSDNEKHAYRTGLKKAAYLGKFGKDHNQSIAVLAVKDTSILEFESKTACAKHFNVSVTNIWRAVKFNGICKDHKIYTV